VRRPFAGRGGEQPLPGEAQAQGNNYPIRPNDKAVLQILYGREVARGLQQTTGWQYSKTFPNRNLKHPLQDYESSTPLTRWPANQMSTLQTNMYVNCETCQDYEVIYFIDALDEYVMSNLAEYDGHKFFDASKEDLKIGKDKAEKEADKKVKVCDFDF